MSMLIDTDNSFLSPMWGRDERSILRLVTPIVCNHIIRTTAGTFSEQRAEILVTQSHNIDEELGYIP